MAERKAFLVRVDPALLAALQRWADDELRSLNGQIEYVLRDALRKAGRLKMEDA
ncbi:MAG: Arc family DNA binding domain-containing protein [Gemmatimonadaceae bacterium]